MALILPATQAAARAAEADAHFRSARILAALMPSVPTEQKRAVGRAILISLRCFLASASSANFWSAQ